MNAPAITALMPLYNDEKYLRKAIDSILNQTFTHFEFLIINDGSTDSTGQIILSYTNPRIPYVKNEANLKLIANLNKGFDLALGQQMGTFWFNVTYNGTAAGLKTFNLFNASTLSNYKPLSIIDKVKFFTKALLKQ